MIDTIALMLNSSDYQILEPERFDPHAGFVYAYKGAYIRAVQNPKYHSGSGNYLPRLSLMKQLVHGGYLICLRLEFSIPNLFYGNNLVEVGDVDFKEIVKVLGERLLEMGVITGYEQIAQAPVSKIHYGKNFLLTDYSTPSTYIDEIRRADISKVYDVNQTDYRNEGLSLKYRTNTFELVFYDKIQDIAKARVSPKKSMESDPIVYGELIDSVNQKRTGDSPLEVLRMEIRLNSRKRIKNEIQRLNLNVNPTFSELFSQRVAKKICLDHLQGIKEKLIVSRFDDEKSFTNQFSELVRNNPETKHVMIAQYLVFKKISSETDVRKARQLFFPDDPSGWYQFKKKLPIIMEPRQAKAIDKLIQQAKEFKTIRSLDFS